MQLRTRFRAWKDQSPKDRRIGDIFSKFAPFLRMYSEYTTRLKDALNLVESLTKKQKDFAQAVQEVQSMPESRNLSLNIHMSSLHQRLAKYKMLFERYIKTLPEGSADVAGAKNALKGIVEAALHCNSADAKLENFNKLLEIQQSTGKDLVSPTREFVKEGRINKISYKSQDHQERHLFLVRI